MVIIDLYSNKKTKKKDHMRQWDSTLHMTLVSIAVSTAFQYHLISIIMSLLHPPKKHQTPVAPYTVHQDVLLKFFDLFPPVLNICSDLYYPAAGRTRPL